VRPFLFLGTRAEDAVADSEYAAVLSGCGLDERDVRRVRLERDPLGGVDLDDWSGVILGGGPFNVSDPEEAKSPAQRRAEAELHGLAERAVAADFPFLGACYGIGVLGTLRGGVVDRTYTEPISSLPITLTDAGVADPLLGEMPRTFDAFLGHKEAVTRLPDGAVLLASSATCPVHAFRIGTNVYATQFHPELDVEGLCLRIETYRHHGYFNPPEAVVGVLATARASHVEHPVRLLARFVELYAR
jgi:GMP synthase (glutamine-hydrolysing)